MKPALAIEHNFSEASNKEEHTIGFDCLCKPLTLSGIRKIYGWEQFNDLIVFHRDNEA